MASAQFNLRHARRTHRGSVGTAGSRPGRFVGNRAKEAGYGLFFASVFLLCQSPANSLAIDDIRVLSRLGEPLVAEVVVSPAAGEVLNRGCFRAQRSGGDLPDVGTVRLSLTRSVDFTVLRIAGSQPMREPLSEFVLQVRCPGVPTMLKSFLVMVDPPTVADVFSVPDGLAAPVTAAVRQSTPRQAKSPQRRAPDRAVGASRSGPIEPGSQYTVRPGDTLSAIASRVAGRPDWSVWPIAQHIYANNPGAFMLGDPNVIAEGAVVHVPRLTDVNMLVSAEDRRPAAVVVPARPTPATGPTPDTVTEAVSTPPAKPPVVTKSVNIAQIMPTPTVATIQATLLPAMQLTTQLFRESQLKIELRAQGSPVVSTVVNAETAPVNTMPEPQSQPERPDDATTGTRAVLQPNQSAQVDSRLNWLWIAVGLFTGLLIGALAAVSLFRRNLRHEYEHDVLDAVQRQVQSEKLRARRDQSATGSFIAVSETPSVARPITDEPAKTIETPQVSMDHTVEMNTVENLDFEVMPHDEMAKTGAPQTLEMPGIASGLDLELTAENGKTGQHEVDFDLLEAAYSDDYQSEFVNSVTEAGVENTDDVQESETVDDAERYYHLENRDLSDETPLPIELGDDEMGSDAGPGEDAKVVRFRR